MKVRFKVAAIVDSDIVKAIGGGCGTWPETVDEVSYIQIETILLTFGLLQNYSFKADEINFSS